MTVALRLKAGGVLVLALAGLLMGAAAVVGIIPVTPPALIAPALAALGVGLAAVKVAAVGAALLTFARKRESIPLHRVAATPGTRPCLPAAAR